MSLAPEELAAFQGLLTGMLGTSNEVRKQAELTFTQTKTQHPEKLIVALLTVLGSPGEETVRHAASVHVWKSLRAGSTYAKENIYGALSPPVAAAVKQQLLQVLGAEQSGMIRRKLAEAVGELGCVLCAAEPDQWPELLPAVFTLTQGASDAKETAVRVLREMVAEPRIGERLLQQHQQATGQLLLAGLQDPSAQTRCQTLLLIFGFVENGTQQKQLAQMLPQIITVVQGLATPQTTEELTDVLTKLVEMTEEEAAWFKNVVPTLFETMLGLSRAKDQLDDSIRRLAFEFLVSFAEKKTKLCLKLPNITRQLMSLSLEFMLEFEDDAGWEQHADEDDEDATNYDVGLENVDRLAKAFEADVACPVVFQLVGEYLNQTWKHKVTALMTLSQVAETVEEEDQVDQIINLLIQATQDPHMRVRYAALHAIGQTSTDHQPYVQEKHGDRLVQVLMGAMDDPVDRVKSHACASFVNLGEELSQDTMLQFTQPLMGKIFPLVQSRSRHVREQAITAIAVVAGCIEEHFVPYYQHIIPHLKQVVASCTSKEERNLRGKAFECISLIGLSVGKDTFKADAGEVMQAMMQTLASNMEPDDPQKSFIEEAVNRVCRTLKADFISFVPPLLEHALRVLSIKPEKVDAAAVDDDDETDQTYAFLEDGSCIGLKTSQLEDIQSAVNTVYCFVEVLGPLFFDYVQTTAQVVLHLLDFALDNDIREVAISTWAEMLKCTKEGLQQRGQADMSVVTEMLRQFITKLAIVMEKEEDCEQLCTIAGGVGDAIKAAPDNCLNQVEITQVVDLTLKLLKESFDRREELKQKEKQGEVDEDDADEIEGQKEADESVRLKLCEIAGALMKTHKALWIQVGMPKFSQLVQTLMTNKDDQLLGIYVACDFLDHVGEASQQVWPLFMPFLLESLNHKSEDLRQACAYGAGVAAKIPAFSQYATQAVTRVVNGIQDPKAQKKKYKTATENLVAALGKICQFQGPSVPMVEAQWAIWLANLPITADAEEGVKVHKQLCELINAKHVPLIGANGENLGKCFAVLAEVYKSNSSDDEVNAAIRTLMAQMGEAGLASMQLNEKQKKKVHRVVRDCQSGKQ